MCDKFNTKNQPRAGSERGGELQSKKGETSNSDFQNKRKDWDNKLIIYIQAILIQKQSNTHICQFISFIVSSVIGAVPSFLQ